MSKPFSISIVMPALNEAANLEAAVSSTLAGFDEFGFDGEVIIVNDGSTDQTGALADAFAAKEPRVRVLHHASPKGIGASFWEGVDAATKASVCMLPGDDENDPSEIFRYATLLEHVDMVIPFVFNKEARSLFRNGLSFMYRFIVNTTFLVYLNYTNGTVVYRKSLLDELPERSTGFFFQTDILIRTIKRGYLFAEVPYRLRLGKGGESKAVSFPSLLQVARGYVRLAKDHYAPGRAVPAASPFANDSMTATRTEESLVPASDGH